MKRLGLAAAAAAATFSALVLAAPTASAQTQSRPLDSSNVGGQSSSASRVGGSTSSAAATAGPPAKISAADKARGQKEAPALVTASDVKTCEIADAAFRGAGTSKTPDGKSVKVTIYEVACQSGPGYLVSAAEGQPKPQMINCVISSAGSGLKCALPGNVDLRKGLGDYVRQAGRTCDINQQRYVGSNATGTNYYEVGCTGGAGFLISASGAGGTAQAVDCQSVQGTPQACQFTSKAQILVGYQAAVAKSGKSCQISDARPVGADKTSGDMFTEIACSGAPGFMLQQDSAGAFKAAIDCDRADRIADGCKLTDVAAARANRSGSYAKLAAQAGFPCQVSNSRLVGVDGSKRDVVELACSDRPDGALAAFSDASGSLVYDCVRARALGGQSCTLTQPSAVYPKYSEILAAKSNGGCKVSDASFMGATVAGGATGKTDYVETTCASGVRGFVIGFKSGTSAVSQVLTCTQAADAGLPCEMKPNLPVNK